jgi:hypothetical protein
MFTLTPLILDPTNSTSASKLTPQAVAFFAKDKKRKKVRQHAPQFMRALALSEENNEICGISY